MLSPQEFLKGRWLTCALYGGTHAQAQLHSLFYLQCGRVTDNVFETPTLSIEKLVDLFFANKLQINLALFNFLLISEGGLKVQEYIS